MENKIEFITTRNQYLFSVAVKNIEIIFLTLASVTIFNLIFNTDGNFGLLSTLISASFMAIFIFIFSVGYMRFKLDYLKSELPKLIINDSGVTINEFGQEQEFLWPEITNVSVKGFFRKIIKLNDNKKSANYQIEYYLFSPEQRRKIIAILKSETGKQSH